MSKEILKFEEVFSYDNLYEAYLNCRKGKRTHKTVITFDQYHMQAIVKLQKRLLSGKYKARGIYQFTIFEPKQREITANYFEDKLVQWVLSNKVLKPTIDPKLIHDNYATRDKHGTSLAIRRAVKFTYSFAKSQDFKPTGYVLSCDIKKYFYNIDRYKVSKMMKQLHIDDKLKKLLDTIIWSYGYDTNPYVDDINKGLCIGFQTSQWLAIYYLNGLDHFIKEKLHIKYYGRYMDDFYLIHEDKEYLKYCWKEIEKYLNEKLDLTLNKKTTIFEFKQGITFLGYKIKFNYDKNCVDVKIRQKSINKHMRKYSKQLKLVEKKELDPETVLQSLESWYSYSDYKQEKKNKKVLRIYNLQKAEIKDLINGIIEENKDPEIKENEKKQKEYTGKNKSKKYKESQFRLMLENINVMTI